MASRGDVHSILYRGPNPLEVEFKPQFDPNKQLGRLWAGKPPAFAEDGIGFDEDGNELDEFLPEDVAMQPKVPFVSVRGVVPPVVNTELQDRRLQLIEKAKETAEGTDISERLRKRRKIRASCIVVPPPDASSATSAASGKVTRLNDQPMSYEETATQPASQKSDSTALKEPLENHRARMKQAALAHRKEEEAQLEKETMETEEFEEEECSSNDGNDEIEEHHTSTFLRKPVFVSMSKRETFRERDLIEGEEDRRREMEKQRLAERKKETQAHVVETLMKEREAAAAAAAIEGEVNEEEEFVAGEDNDDLNCAEEYELWKIRELKRIKRDREEGEARQIFLAEMEKRRRMTEEERREHDKLLDAQNPKLQKGSKYQFLQKYYHPGAFYQDEKYTGKQPLYMRDFNLPVGEDALDKKTLPNVMQKRRGQFGRAGQTKYTHLVDNDTTDFNSLWAQSEKTGPKPRKKETVI